MRTHTIFTFFLCLAVCIPVASQTNPNIENGLKPYGMYNGGDVDSVSLTNQNLVFHGPLWGYPQRGTLSQNYFLLYNAKNWKIFKWCNNQTGTCNERWQWNGNNVQLTTDEGASVAWTWYSIGGYVYTAGTWDGATHQMAVNNAGGIETIDASGIYYDGNINLTGVLRFRNGDRAFGTAQPMEDTNGNQISAASGGGVLDTLGRQLGAGPNSSSDTSGCTSSSAAVTITTFPGPGSGTRMVKLCQVNVSLQTNFHFWDNNYDIYVQEANVSRAMLQDAVLYNGVSWSTSPKWTFQYSDRDPGDSSSINYGNLTQVTLPTGGTITYTYRTLDLCWQSPSPLQVSRGVATRTVDAQDGTGPHTWTYTPWALGANSGIVVTDPAANDVVHTVTGFGYGSGCSYYVTQSQSYQGSHTTGTLLKTVNTDYSWIPNPEDVNGDGTPTAVNVRPTRVTTTWPNGQVSKVEKDYDTHLSFSFAGTNYTGSYGNVVEERVFDYGNGAAGPLLRRTDYTYLETNNLLDRVTSAITYDGSGNQVAKTTYGYDQYSLVSSGITTQRDTSVPNPGVRGNRTSVNQWLNTTGGTLTTTTTYYDTGMPYQVTDPGGHTTMYSYSPTYVGAYVTQTNFPDTGSPAVHHIISGGYDFNTGLLTSFTDQNSQPTSYGYEILGRIASASFPDLGQTTFTYNDTPGSLNVERKGKIDNSGHWTDAYVKFDGLGRARKTALLSDPEGTAYTRIAYDGVGRKYQVWNPTRCDPDAYPSSCPGESTYGITTYNYDALGRPASLVPSVVQTDGSQVLTSYSGNCTTVTDEAGKRRKSCLDALGRMTQVFEDPSSLNYETDYQYDVLGNLTRVDQKGNDPNSANWRTRTFGYNSLSQLLTASNPESGTISYTYDNDGNVLTKTAPMPNQTGSSTVTSTYSYDALHRLTGKTYSNGDPAVSYFFDQSSYNGLTITNGIGRRTGMSDSSGATAWSYDPMGRALTERRTISGITKSTGYTYNLDGSLATLAPASGRTITYTYSAAARALSAVDATNGINFATAATYAPSGGLAGVKYGVTGGFTGIVTTNSYNKRLQPVILSAAAPTQTVLSLSYDFHLGTGNNGNVFLIQNNRDTNRTQTFTYDQLNRIAFAWTSGSLWGERFEIDPWANLNKIRACQAGDPCYGKPQGENLDQSSGGKNQLVGYSYDAAGNMLNDGLGHSFAYDGENRIKTATGVNYTYDGDGKRVKKDSGKLYWTGTGSDPLTETDLSGTPTADYVFFKGKRIARVDSASGTIPQTGWAVTYVDSQETTCENGAAGNAIDGNNSSKWVTHWCNGNSPPYPHDIRISLGGTYIVTGFTYLPRQDNCGNAWIRGYQLYVSTDGTNWAQVASGNFDYSGLNTACPGGSNPPAQQVNFSFVAASYIRLVGTSENSGHPWATAAEMNVLGRGTGVHYYFSDHLGSASVITNATGTTIEQEADYYPYGGERIITAGLNNYKFTGKERDSETGLDYFGARHQGSMMGRFMTPDPVFFQASMLTDPQRFNQYAYVRNSPLRLIDPKGEAIRLSGDADQRQKEMDALCGAVGNQACSYLYQNAVTTTDANGNTTTNYYTGIYTNGPAGNGPAFENLNSVAGELSAIIKDTQVAEMQIVSAGTSVEGHQIGPYNGSPYGPTPGLTYKGSDGKVHVVLLDSSTSPGILPSRFMKRFEPGAIDAGILSGHELGHARALMTGGNDYQQGESALRLENKVRLLRDPSANTRLYEHDPIKPPFLGD